jgi:ABC-type Fe3+ transport system permease subunit
MAFGFSFDVHSFRFIQGSESAEFWKAFSWTMLYGLTFATVMTLIVLPALQFVKYRVRERRGWTGD